MRLSRLTLLGVGAIALAALLTYGPTLRSGLVWDDDFHFAANPHMRSVEGLVEIWTSRAAVYYPLTLTTFWFLIRIFGFNTFVLHGANIALHVANALLLWAVMRRLRLPGGWLAAMLFLTHPINVESVAWITEMKNTQSGLFYLLTILFLARAGLFDAGSARGPWFVAALAAFGAAILSKTSAVMLPAALLVLVWWRGRLSLEAAKSLAPFFFLSALAAGWTIWEQRYSSGATGFEWEHGLVSRLALAGQVSAFYLRKLLWPDPLMFIYPRWDIGISAMSLAPGAALAAAAAALAAVSRNATARALLAASLVYLINLFPVMGFFDIYFSRYSFVADHFAYLPLVPIFALAGYALAELATPHPGRESSWSIHLPAVVLVSGILVGGGMLFSIRHARAFRSEEALWNDTLAKNPGAWMVHNNLGASLANRNQPERAEYHYREALRHNPMHYEAMCNLGNLLLQRGEIEGAVRLYESALKLKEDFPLVWINLGLARDKAGDPAAAMACFEKALAFDPNYVEGHVKIAGLHERAGRAPDAAASFRRALELHGASAREGAAFFVKRAGEVEAAGNSAAAAAYREEARALVQASGL